MSDAAYNFARYTQLVHPDRVKLSVGFPLFAKTALRIRVLGKGGRYEYVPFVCNREQLELLQRIDADRAAGRGTRIIVCKGRKLGISTLVQGLGFYFGSFLPGWITVTMAHIYDSTRDIAQMSHDFRNKLPAELAPFMTPKIEYGELKWTNGSKLLVKTQGSDDALRGSTPSLLHLSEVGLWHKKRESTTGNEALVSALGALEAGGHEDAAPGTIVIIESTANGAVGPFFDRWQLAQTSKTWTPIFYAWQKAEKYRPPLKPEDVAFLEELANCDGPTKLELWRAAALETLNPSRAARFDEAAQWAQDAMEFRLSPAQLRWAIKKAEELGSRDKFDEEFPLSAAHAFLASGRPVLKQSELSGIAEVEVPPPTRCGRIGRLGGKQGAAALAAAAALVPGDAWVFYAPPEAGWRDRYIVAADVASGSEGDYAAICVYDRVQKRQVAEFHSNETTPSDLAVELDTVGCLYHNAVVAPEANNHGHVVVRALFEGGYRNLYKRQVANRPDRLIRPDEWSLQFGWDTTPTTRTVMLDDVVAAIRAGAVRLHSTRLKRELGDLVYDKRQRIDHRRGGFSDLTVALAIALQVDKQLSPPVDAEREQRRANIHGVRVERTNRWLGARVGGRRT